MVETVVVGLVVAGVAIIAVLLVLRRAAERIWAALEELLAIDEAHGQDPLALLEQAAPTLRRAGLNDYGYVVDMLGSRHRRILRSGGERISCVREGEEYSVRIELAPDVVRGEQRYLHTLLARMLTLLVEKNILLRLQLLDESFQRMARLQTYILHDVKNLAQWLSGLAWNLEHSRGEGQRELLMQNIERALPALSRRAARITRVLELGEHAPGERPLAADAVPVGPLVEALAEQYALAVELQGEACVRAPREHVEMLFDVLFKNLYDKAQGEPGLQVRLALRAQGEHAVIRIADSGSPLPAPERVFEPFHSRREGGTGLGLHLASRLAVECGGELRHLPLAQGAVFELLLPRAAPELPVSPVVPAC